MPGVDLHWEPDGMTKLPPSEMLSPSSACATHRHSHAGS